MSIVFELLKNPSVPLSTDGQPPFSLQMSLFTCSLQNHNVVFLSYLSETEEDLAILFQDGKNTLQKLNFKIFYLNDILIFVSTVSFSVFAELGLNKFIKLVKNIEQQPKLCPGLNPGQIRITSPQKMISFTYWEASPFSSNLTNKINLTITVRGAGRMHRTASERMSAQGWQNRLYFCAYYNNSRKLYTFLRLMKCAH